MNNTITIYELLGLIKDDKAPNSIIYKREYFKYSKENRDYIGENNYLFSDFADLISILNDKVEILEEDKPIIEPITLDDWHEITYEQNWDLLTNDFNLNTRLIIDRLGKVIDYINRKEDK